MQTLIKIWLIPPAINILAIVIGVMLLRRFYKTGVLLIVFSAASLFLLSTYNVSSRLVRSLEKHEALQIKDLPSTDKMYIVVAGASHYTFADEFGTSSPTPDGLVRLHYAASLGRRTMLPILLTGGPIPTTIEPHAEVMANTLEREYNITAQQLEKKSRNTLENALFSAEILKAEGVTRIILVTHSYHMARSEMFFKHAGFDVIPAPTELSHHYELTDTRFWKPDPNALSLSASAIYEHIALLWYGLKLNIEPEPSLPEFAISLAD